MEGNFSLHRYFLILCGIIGLTFILSACGQTLMSGEAATTGRIALSASKRFATSTIIHSPATTLKPTPVTDSPTRLIIPAIQVDAPIEQVSVLPSGELDTPGQNPWTDVGWYKSGALPGTRGSAVIDGHLNRPGGSPAIFWSLHSLQAGNNISVVLTSGKTLQFIVTRTALYPPQDAPLQDIFGDQSGSYLNLITCAGDWVNSQHQMTLRMVVYASLR